MGIFETLTTYFEHLTSKQYVETDSLISEDFSLEALFQRYDVLSTLWYIMITIKMHIVEQ